MIFRSCLHLPSAMHRGGKQQSKQGPALPSKLNKELSASDSQLGPRNERVSKAFAIADRKAQRKAKRQQKGQRRHQSTQKRRQQQFTDLPPAEQHIDKKRKVQATQQVPRLPFDVHVFFRHLF